MDVIQVDLALPVEETGTDLDILITTEVVLLAAATSAGQVGPGGPIVSAAET